MKRLNHRVTRVGDNVRIEATFRDRMRTPRIVRISSEKVDPEAIQTADRVLLEGDAADVMGTMTSMAQIAWDMGWRPPGLEVALSHVIKNFKLPEG